MVNLYQNTNVQAASEPQLDLNTNMFPMGESLRCSFDGGYLIPIMLKRVYPGWTYTLHQLSSFVRFNTQITQPFDNAYLEMFAFYVRMRNIWSNFKRFCGQQDSPGDSTDYLMPILDVSSGTVEFDVESVFDYAGLPVEKTIHKDSEFISLGFRAMNQVYNEYFRDENLQNPLPVLLGDGPDPVTNYPLFRRGKRHDYFTSCLPTPQKGDPVNVPLGQYPVISPIDNSVTLPVFTGANPLVPLKSNLLTANTAYNGAVLHGDTTAVDAPFETGMYVNLNASNFVIDDLRNSILLQLIREKNNRYGTRYTEFLQAQYGVHARDAYLDRPELLAVSSTMLQHNTLYQTSSDTQTSHLGQISANNMFRQLGDESLHFSKSFDEQGYLIIFANVRADITYCDGVPREFKGRGYYDQFLPVLSALPDQVVTNEEIYYSGDPEIDNGVFGYQERFGHLRYGRNRVAGKLRSGVQGSLDVYTYTQHFSELPKLNSEFIEDNPPFDRSVAVQNEPIFTGDFYFDANMVGPLPLYGVPMTFGVRV